MLTLDSRMDAAVKRNITSFHKWMTDGQDRMSEQSSDQLGNGGNIPLPWKDKISAIECTLCGGGQDTKSVLGREQTLSDQ
jgi:hypothetical protein